MIILTKKQVRRNGVNITIDAPMTAVAAPRTMAHLLNAPATLSLAPTVHQSDEAHNQVVAHPPVDIRISGEVGPDQLNESGVISEDNIDIPSASEYESSGGYSEQSLHIPKSVVEVDSDVVSNRDNTPTTDNEGLTKHPTALTKPRAFDLFASTKEKALKAKSSQIKESSKRSIKDVGWTSSEEDSDSEEETNSRTRRPRKTPKMVDHKQTSTVGISKSAQAARALNASVDNGSFVKSAARWEKFVAKIKDLDNHAEFDVDGDPRKVQHSLCTRVQKMDELYNVGAFSQHIKTCLGPTKAAKKKMAPSGSQSIAQLFGKPSPLSTALPGMTEAPCPGLNPANVSPTRKALLEKYLLRTPVAGAGGPTYEAMTAKLYPGQEYSSLSVCEKREVRAAQRQRHRWRIFADLPKVFASSCTQSVRIRMGQMPVPPCSQCQALFTDNAFKNALAKPLPAPENAKFTPRHLVNRTAVEQYGRISGLGALIDANEKVSDYFLHRDLY